MPSNPSSKFSRRPGKGAEKLLGELELAIMRVAWSRTSVTVRDVLSTLTKKRTLAYTTVMTIMGRLVVKGLLVAEKDGKTYRYRVRQTRAEFETHAAGQVVHSLITDFGGEVALSQFVKELAEINPEQLKRLAELARQAQAGKDED